MEFPYHADTATPKEPIPVETRPDGPDDGTTTHTHVIQQVSWYRGALNFTLIPLATSVVMILTFWLSDALRLISLASGVIGICLFPSLLCLMRYVSMARRDPEGGQVTFLKRLVLVFFMIGLNVSVAIGAVVYAASFD